MKFTTPRPEVSRKPTAGELDKISYIIEATNGAMVKTSNIIAVITFILALCMIVNIPNYDGAAGIFMLVLGIAFVCVGVISIRNSKARKIRIKNCKAGNFMVTDCRIVDRRSISHRHTAIYRINVRCESLDKSFVSDLIGVDGRELDLGDPVLFVDFRDGLEPVVFTKYMFSEEGLANAKRF